MTYGRSKPVDWLWSYSRNQIQITKSAIDETVNPSSGVMNALFPAYPFKHTWNNNPARPFWKPRNCYFNAVFHLQKNSRPRPRLLTATIASVRSILSPDPSRKLLRIKVTPDLHLTYCKNGGILGLVLKMKNKLVSQFY